MDPRRVLLVAARQIELTSLLEHEGFEVDVHTRPLDRDEEVSADVALVFRGRLIGRQQAATLSSRGIPVIEVMTVEPPSSSTAGWIRLSNRIGKADLVQVVHAVADWSRLREPASASS